MKRIFPAALLTVGILSLSACGQTPDLERNWQPYLGTDFELSYPSSWQTETEENGVRTTVSFTYKGEIAFSVSSAPNQGGVTLEEWSEEFTNQSAYTRTDTLLISDLTAYKFVSTENTETRYLFVTPFTSGHAGSEMFDLTVMGLVEPAVVDEILPSFVLTSDVSSESSTTLTIMVPKDEALYAEKMTEFVQAGGEDPLETMEFIEKELVVPYTSDVIKASAQAAAEELAPSGGPAKASVAYFQVKSNVAYVLLDIDLDGWAGVSVSIATIHPLVEKTLLQFPEIHQVVFDYAPASK